MPAAVRMRTDYSAYELRRLAAATKNANQSRRLLSLAAVLEGMNRTEAARIGGMDRQTLRDWVHRFNEQGPDGLKDTWSSRKRSTRRPAAGPCWLAHDCQPPRAQEPDADLPAFPCPRVEPGGEHLAIHARQLAVEQGLQLL